MGNEGTMDAISAIVSHVYSPDANAVGVGLTD
jgi:hypothetical protein